MKLMVFLHGTAIMHATAAGRARAERVRQSSQREPSVFDFAPYVPTEAAVQKVRAWQRNGAEICDVLAAHGFPAGPVFFRAPGEGYAEVARRAGPDVVVEDDCESIGGGKQMTASGLARSADRAIRCVIVPEFGGLAHLPDSIQQLAAP